MVPIQFANTVASETERAGAVSARSMRRQTCSLNRGGSEGLTFHSCNRVSSGASSFGLFVFMGFNFSGRRDLPSPFSVSDRDVAARSFQRRDLELLLPEFARDLLVARVFGRERRTRAVREVNPRFGAGNHAKRIGHFPAFGRSWLERTVELVFRHTGDSPHQIRFRARRQERFIGGGGIDCGE